MATNLSIIIPVYNALDFTKECLSQLSHHLSLLDSGKLKANIVVVDDGSKDGTSAWIQANFPEVSLLHGNGNLWWSGGMNEGIKHAIDDLGSDYILLWNNDVRPSPVYFDNLARILENNPDDTILLSKVYMDKRDEKILFSLGGNFNPYTGKHGLIGFGRKAENFPSPDLEINWFPGMGTTIHKSVFKRIGLFDHEHFPQYKGDSDFALRAYKSGFKLKLYNELEIWNDRDNTGYSNDKSWKVFFQSLVSKKSNSNIYRDLLFYQRHAKSFLAYRELLRKYYYHIGGFIKWKILGIFGHKRTSKF